MQLEPIDPLALDLDTADQTAAVDRASFDDSGLDLVPMVGPAKLTALRLGIDGRPAAGVWLAREGNELLGCAVARFPVEDNTDSAHVGGVVHPQWRRRGVGRALTRAAVDLARAAGRPKAYAGAWREAGTGPAMASLGFSRAGLGVNAVRRLDLHGAPYGLWDRLYDEARVHAADYEILHQVGVTSEESLPDMVRLHEAINDAPLDDPDAEPDHWDADRVRAHDQALAGRRNTVYRVIARHRPTGEWAGLSMVLVDEFAPTLAHQEDTTVVRDHRGHRLGLLMKADMLRWMATDRPEVAATDTWNATTNHHMIAVNERLSCRVVAHHETYRLDV